MDSAWNVISEQPHERERRALKYLESLLPKETPFRGWANFEFVALDGAAFDVDALVVCRSGVFLLEFVSRRGVLELGERTWVQTQQNNARLVFDNPYQLAARKARLLRSLLDDKTTGAKAPHIEPVVWLTEPDVGVSTDGRAAEHVVFHRDVGRSSVDQLILHGEGPAVRKSSWNLSADVRDRLGQALEAVGVGPSGRSRRYADWRLKSLLHAGPRHQDWMAEHVSRGDLRRARIYSTPRDLPDSELARLQEAARREFEILRGLQHPNILAVEQHIKSERRPGLLFAHPGDALRLDHWLDANDVSIDAKCAILIQVAEAIRYAHRKSVVHRALTPQSILVVPTAEGPRALVYNWHTSKKAAVETGTAHIHDYMDDVAQAYLAPELSRDPAAGEAADVYGIGAIAFRLFAGRPPANSLADLVDVLIKSGGLRPSRLVDGILDEVDQFVYDATRAVASERLSSMTAVIDALDSIRRDIASGRSAWTDPLEAGPDDELDGQFRVVRRIGVGSTATALLAVQADQEVVLKIANNDGQNKRLRAEAKALSEIDHLLIVNLLDTVELGGRLALVLQNAGSTLRERLRQGALSLDELRRFGEDLCDILVELESIGVLHRDIKPANLGIGTPSGSSQRLMLFDFSLADVPLDAWDVGTPTYRDPFIRDASRRRWDEYADRFSAALTLYEMVTGRLPEWGDGRTDPVFDDTAQCVVESDLFPAPVREPLERFFRRSFARDVGSRFDNAADSKDAWRQAFQTTTHTAHDSLEDLLREATPDTRVSTLGLSAIALDALDRLDVVSIRELIALQQQALQFQKGVSNAIRRELADLRSRLVEQFPVEAGLAEVSHPDDAIVDAGRLSVDQVLERLTGEASKDPVAYRAFVAAILGESDLLQALPWQSVADLADRTEREFETFEEQFQQLRERWERKRILAPLRDDIVRLVENSDGALADVDLARRVLGLRGSVLDDASGRMAAAAAICRAAVEAELAAHEPRVFLVRLWSGSVFVVSREELGDALQPLGHRATALVAKHGVVSPSRAESELQKVLTECGVGPLPQLRLLTLAAAAAKSVALSSRNEMYPVGLSGEHAIKLCAGIFVAGEDFTPAEIHARVRARYPQVADLPGHPQLGKLFAEVGLNFKWDPSRRQSDGAYVNVDLRAASLTRSTLATSFQTTSDVESAQYSITQRFRERLEYKTRYGGFLVLTVDPRKVPESEAWLTKLHPMTVVSLDELFITTLRARAQENEIDWAVVLEADGDDGEDWARLQQLIKFQVVPSIEQQLLAYRGDVLLVNPGLIARYADAGAMRLIDVVYQHCGTPDGPRMAWMLVPGDRRHAAPMIEQTLIPTLHASEHARVPLALDDRFTISQGQS